MTPLFNIASIRPADFFHIQSAGRYGASIQEITGSVGTHDALFISQHTLGESTVRPPFAHFTDIGEYESKMRKGLVKVSILRIPGLSTLDQCSIANAWCKHVRGDFYDFSGIAKIWIKRATIQMLEETSPAGEKARGWSWAHWCTEGLRTACLKGTDGRIDPLRKENPTPRTVENRVRQGKLVDVTKTCLTDEGMPYRLLIPETV